MTLRQTATFKGLFLATVIIGLVALCSAAQAQSRIGKNLDEITRLAAQGEKIRFASALREDEVDLVFKCFFRSIPISKWKQSASADPTAGRKC
jgi:hypothetical protein